MIDIQYIDDPRGGRLPMTDAFGNLTLEVMFLYNQKALSKENMAAIDAVLAQDEMARDAMEGYALINSDKKAKATISALKKGFASGVVEEPIKPVLKLDIRKVFAVAAAIVLIVVGTIVVSKFVRKKQLAENIEVKEKQNNLIEEESIKKIETTPEIADTIHAGIDGHSSEVAFETEPMEAENPEGEADLMVIDKANSGSFNENSLVDNKRDNQNVNNFKYEDTSRKKAELEERLAQLRNQKSRLGNTDEDKLENDEEEIATLDKVVITEIEPISTTAEPAPPEIMKLEEESKINSIEKRKVANAEQKESEYMMTAQNAQETPNNGYADSSSAGILGNNTSPIFFTTDEVDELPRFPGGDIELFRFIEKRKIHPPNLLAQGIGGEVFVSFNINANGKVINVKPLRSNNSQMEADAIRVIRSMPNWQPAKINDKAVSVKKTILIKYPVK